MNLLYDYQMEAVQQMKNGSVLCGGVGSGKSRTALYYYLFKDCRGSIPFMGEGKYREMEYPKDLYIITTAKKRDSLEWEKECSAFVLRPEADANAFGINVTIDSWNNIKKYKDVVNSFFIFDEQRVIGGGAWVKTFLTIVKKNHWILLSATPGDQWIDYIPLFIANGFYKNKTEFNARHCVFSRFSKYPRIERYVGEKELIHYRDEILVPMKDRRLTQRHEISVDVEYDRERYRMVYLERWNPYENIPIEESGKWVYLLRKVVNEDPSRLLKVGEIFEEKNKCIIFYNYVYELEILMQYFKSLKDVIITQWNGQKHEEIPNTERWVYLVQYNAGSEGWNCITTDTIIFYSQNYSYRMTEQAMGRIDRINTPFLDLYYYKFRSRSPIDIAIHRALKNKKTFNELSFIKKETKN